MASFHMARLALHFVSRQLFVLKKKNQCGGQHVSCLILFCKTSFTLFIKINIISQVLYVFIDSQMDEPKPNRRGSIPRTWKSKPRPQAEWPNLAQIYKSLFTSSLNPVCQSVRKFSKEKRLRSESLLNQNVCFFCLFYWPLCHTKCQT